MRAFPLAHGKVPAASPVFQIGFRSLSRQETQVGIACRIHECLRGNRQPSALVFHDDMAELPFPALRCAQPCIVPYGNAGLSEQSFQRQHHGRRIIIHSEPCLCPLRFAGGSVPAGRHVPARPCRRAAALDTFSQQFLADSADYLVSIAVAQRKVHHNQPKRSQTAQGRILFPKAAFARLCARRQEPRPHPRFRRLPRPHPPSRLYAPHDQAPEEPPCPTPFKR